jgi:Na+-transporting methylmalonyl-CoA/oxaloacetate decarboxylase gamma subunit
MTLFEKAFISFLVSVFLISGIVILVYIGFFNNNYLLTMPNSLKALAFVVVFLVLFLLIFLMSNLKRVSSKKKKTAAVPPAVAIHQGGLLAAASRLSSSSSAGIDETYGQDVIYEKNGVPYIKSDTFSPDNNPGNLDGNFVKLVEAVKGPLAPSVPRQQDKP